MRALSNERTFKRNGRFAYGSSVVAVLLATACGAAPDSGQDAWEAPGRVALSQKKFTPTSCTTDTDMDGSWQDQCALHGGERTECSGGTSWCCRSCTKQEGCEERCSQNPDDLDRPAAAPQPDTPPDTLAEDPAPKDAAPTDPAPTSATVDTSAGDCTATTSDEPLGDISIFADACVASGGGLTCKSEQAACCSLCSDKDGCQDLCFEAKELVADAASSAELDKLWEELVIEALPGSTARQHGGDVDTFNLCKRVCRFVWHGCDALPIPVDDWGRSCWMLGMDCVGVCADRLGP